MLSFLKRYKSILVVVFLASTSFTTYAQNSYKIGVNLSTRWSRQIHPAYQSQYAFWLNGLGVSIVRSVRSKVSFESGLIYSHASSTFSNLQDLRYTYDAEGELTGIETVGTMNLVERYNYLSLPILGRYAVVNASNTKVFLIGGISFDWLINRRNDYNTTFDGERKETFATGLNTKKINKTVRIGFGVERNINSHFSIMLSPSVNHEFMSPIERKENFTSLGLSISLFYI